MAHSLFRQLVVAVAIGNLDMHAKNISVLHLPDGACRLAPAYDMVPQSHLPTDGELALAVNDKYGHADVTATDLVAEGERWQISGASSIVDQVLSRLAAAVRGEVPLEGAHPGLAEEIGSFVDRLRRGDPVGGQPRWGHDVRHLQRLAIPEDLRQLDTGLLMPGSAVVIGVKNLGCLGVDCPFGVADDSSQPAILKTLKFVDESQRFGAALRM